MKPQAFIFIGRSGCGKGTQVDLLMKVLAAKDPAISTLYIQTGQELREFITGPKLTQKKAKEIYDTGGLEPEFLTVHMWVRPLVELYTGNQHLIFDGTPRKVHEAGVLNSIFDFYGFGKPWVVHIEIGAEEATRRLLARQRQDDSADDIRERLAWYETNVVPTINYYVDNPAYHFVRINGERSIESIHEDIVQKLGLR